MSAYTTKLGSLENYEKGSIQIIQGEATNYAFSNKINLCKKQI